MSMRAGWPGEIPVETMRVAQRSNPLDLSMLRR
jgi:hypothetical protein